MKKTLKVLSIILLLGLGFLAGYSKGTNDGYMNGTRDGYLNGKEEGYLKGKEEGYLRGVKTVSQLDESIKDKSYISDEAIGSSAECDNCLTLPPEITAKANEIGCVIDKDFLEVPGIGFPFVYGYLPGHEGFSFVFGCEKPNEEYSKRYKIVIHGTETKPKKYDCPDIINDRNAPRGLSIITPSDESLTMEYFVNMQNPSIKGSADEHISHNVIRSYYDGVEDLFYCHEGQWWIRQFH